MNCVSMVISSQIHQTLPFMIRQSAIVEKEQRVAQRTGTSHQENEINVVSSFQPFPLASAREVSIVLSLFPLFLVFAFFPFVQFLLVNIVSEKQEKLREGMLMMGLAQSTYWLSWFLTYAFIMLFTVVLILLIGGAGSVWPWSAVPSLFVLFYSFAISLIPLAFLISIFFNNARVAGMAGGFFVIVNGVVNLPLQDKHISAPVRWMLSIFSPLAFGQALASVFDRVALQLPVGIGSITKSQDELSVLDGIIMILVDIVAYSFLAWYLGHVFPNDYGTVKPWYFLFMPSFWFSSRESANERGDNLDDQLYHPEDIDLTTIESVPQEIRKRPLIKIRALRKEYDNSSFRCLPKRNQAYTVPPTAHENAANDHNEENHHHHKRTAAVEHLDLEIYAGEIFALLGHNGAGKSTTIGILTGLIPPSSGSASICGYSIKTQMDLVRQNIGVCPQHDVLFSNLTVLEQLRIFAGIRGIQRSKVEEEIKRRVDEVSLGDKMNAKASTLSAGQKRRLSVAISFLGNPKVVFLDEPTAGLDPHARREIWAMLQHNRGHDRAIVLTTHYMDEADMLAERKGIMSAGLLRAIGSSLFLKSRFGRNYYLHITRGTTYDPEAVEAFIHDKVRGQVARNSAGELVFALPLSSLPLFSEFFRELEEKSSEFGILTYGLTMTSLEEVFLKMGEDERVREKKQDDEKRIDWSNDPLSSSLSCAEHEEIIEEENSSLLRSARKSPNDGEDHIKINENSPEITRSTRSQQYFALLFARLRQKSRSKALFFWQFIVPIILCLAALIFVQFISKLNAQTNPTPSTDAHQALFLWPGLYDTNGTFDVPFLNLTGSPIDLLEQTSAWSTQAHQSVQFVTNDQNTNLTDFNLFLMDDIYQGAYEFYPESAVNFRYNQTCIHSLPIMVNMLTGALLNSKNASTTIQFASHPFHSYATGLPPFNSANFVLGMFMGIGLMMIPVGFVSSLIEDRRSRFKQQLIFSGLHRTMYWACQFTLDALSYLFVGFSFIVLVAAFHSSFTGGSFAPFCVALILSNLSILSISFLLSFAFDEVDTALRFLPLFFQLSAMIPFLAVALLTASSTSKAEWVHLIFSAIDPPYALLGVLTFITFISEEQQLQAAAAGEVPDLSASVFFKQITIWLPILFMVIWILISWLSIFIIENGFFSRKHDANRAKPRQPQPYQEYYNESQSKNLSHAIEINNSPVYRRSMKLTSPASVGAVSVIAQAEAGDEDVMAETDRVNRESQDKSSGDLLVLSHLCKEFSPPRNLLPWLFQSTRTEPIVAVEDLTIGVRAGECIGLLGPNGAGKTTTLSVLMGEQQPTSGDASVCGHSILSSLPTTSALSGICQQVDAYPGDLTGYELLKLFATVKGVPRQNRESLIRSALADLDISEYALMLTQRYSGGTRRKLSAAIALIGDPKVLYLDEPSSGVDPGAKRFLWDVISNKIPGRAILLTTHAMEEADAVCTKLAIMINGRFCCLGSSQHLKNKYGSGYLLEIKVGRLRADGQRSSSAQVDTFVKEMFPAAELEENFLDVYKYLIPVSSSSGTVLSVAFHELENRKTDIGIEDYSISQTTLEQVFLKFCSFQKEGEPIRY
eukprot:TRINITY_DN5719_c0_g1_i2.p1 TRINITY_DN5719_c0_g1~~TRINITY_DN5719_c0_g1_i2.p1  ORF type:complete len:1590 (+),score=279.69 TRINITY_DN5719_c0_g1_i2:504-5273(+)